MVASFLMLPPVSGFDRSILFVFYLRKYSDVNRF